MHSMGNAVHHDFKWNRNLLFDLLRRDPRPLRDDLDVVVGYVRISLNGKTAERNDSPAEQDECNRQHHPAVVESKINDPANHLVLHRVLQHQSIRNHLISRLDS